MAVHIARLPLDALEPGKAAEAVDETVLLGPVQMVATAIEVIGPEANARQLELVEHRRREVDAKIALNHLGRAGRVDIGPSNGLDRTERADGGPEGRMRGKRHAVEMSADALDVVRAIDEIEAEPLCPAQQRKRRQCVQHVRRGENGLAAQFPAQQAQRGVKRLKNRVACGKIGQVARVDIRHLANPGGLRAVIEFRADEDGWNGQAVAELGRGHRQRAALHSFDHPLLVLSAGGRRAVGAARAGVRARVGVDARRDKK